MAYRSEAGRQAAKPRRRLGYSDAMGEERHRDKRRRSEATRATEDEAAYLLARVRAGELTQERLELAAYGGDQASRLALGKTAPEHPEGVEAWIEGLARWGRPVCGVAALGVVEFVRDHWRWSWDERLDKAIQALADWIVCPCEQHRLVAREATSNSTWARADYDDPAASQAAHAISWACAVASRSHQRTAGVALDAARTAQVASRVFTTIDVERAAQAALIGWALAPAAGDSP